MTDSSKDLTISDGLEIRNLPVAGFGAQIEGLDPGNITDAQRSTIWDTYRRRHGLICFSFDRLLRNALSASRARFWIRLWPR